MKRRVILIVTMVLSLCLISGCQKTQQEKSNQQTTNLSQNPIKVETTTGSNGESEKEAEASKLSPTPEDKGETDLNISLDESFIIKEQTFPVELNGWGNVTFVTYGPKPGADFEDVSFYLMKDKKVVYAFPTYGENNKTEEIGGLFDSVASVGFRDVNNDSLKDIIVIINYITGAGPQGMEPRPKVRIFLAENKGFHIAKDMIDDISSHMEERNFTINSIYKYLKNK